MVRFQSFRPGRPIVRPLSDPPYGPVRRPNSGTR